jgi:endonuclease/exonuclease/phosphatase family metal-dependent hydrolase
MTSAPRLIGYSLALPMILILLSACEKDKGNAPATIKVGSYNMAILGEAKTARTGTMGVMAKIAARFDVLAMQEVGSNGSTASDAACVKAMDAFLSRVDEAAGGDLYAYVRGNQYAFVYRKDRLEVKSWKLYDGSRAFTYTPLVAYFQVLGRPLDFAMITVHTRPSLAKSEIPSIAAAMEETASALGEADVLCAGDFNADGGYYAEGPGPGLAGFPGDRFVSVIPNDADTTVASDSLAYDRMEISSSMAGDYALAWGILRPGEAFDLSACEGSESAAGTERALSDHYPIWADFSTTADRD